MEFLQPHSTGYINNLSKVVLNYTGYILFATVTRRFQFWMKMLSSSFPSSL